MIMENEEILLEIIALEKKAPLQPGNDSSILPYLESFFFHADNAVFEECFNIDETIKVDLIHNIQYDIKGVSIDGDTPMMRIFTLSLENKFRYFTAMGTDYELGRVVEHSKSEFLNLLNDHYQLKDNHLVKYLKTSLFHQELQEEMQTHEVKPKKPKL